MSYNEYWNNFGSSKSRIKVKDENARSLIAETMRVVGNEVIDGFTDGFCKGNPGPYRVGASLYFSNQESPKLASFQMSFHTLGDFVTIKIP